MSRKPPLLLISATLLVHTSFWSPATALALALPRRPHPITTAASRPEWMRSPRSCRRTTTLVLGADGGDDSNDDVPPPPAPPPATAMDETAKRSLLFWLNASTKWLVTLVHTAAVWWRRDFVAPFIVSGSILAVLLAEVLKRIINQSRPDGAVPLDPGMPSSHALVTTFAAAAWSLHLLGGGVGLAPPAGHSLDAAFCQGLSALLAAGAAAVAWLRVACGYHTVAQVLVGAGIGVVAALGWAGVGAALVRAVTPRAATAGAWAAYLSFSAVFIQARILRSWVSGKKDALT